MIDKMEDWVVGGCAAVLGVITGLYGGWTQGTKVLVVLMVIDYVLGCVCALTGHSPKTVSGHFLSQVAFAGLLKKATIMLVILLACLLDRAVGHAESGGAVMFRSAAEFFYIATEGLSIIENAGLLGAPIPDFLRRMLEALRDKSNEGERYDPPGDNKPEAPTDPAPRPQGNGGDPIQLPPEMIDDGK